jgi:hypothetical protein
MTRSTFTRFYPRLSSLIRPVDGYESVDRRAGRFFGDGFQATPALRAASCHAAQASCIGSGRHSA